MPFFLSFYKDKKVEQIIRRKSRKIYVGKVAVGGDAPISVQSMTNTLTQVRQSTKSAGRKTPAAILRAVLVRIKNPHWL